MMRRISKAGKMLKIVNNGYYYNDNDNDKGSHVIMFIML